MLGYLTDYEGKSWVLPPLLERELSHGYGEPCDAFEVLFAWNGEKADVLRSAVRFRAEHEGVTVFCGVVDEYTLSASSSGVTAEVRGRGIGALLMDNEATAAEYYGASLGYILENHVYPYGIEVAMGEDLKARSFEVASGQSQWKVLSEFCRFCGGTEPRFARDGTLILDGSGERELTLDLHSPIVRQSFSDRRYGVVSSVVVVNRARRQKLTVENADFLARGGCCGRVVNVTRDNRYDAMRDTGEYQIAQSERLARSCRVTLPALFAAFPGDRVTMLHSPLDISGRWTVREARCFAGADGMGTELTLAVEGE